jgi:hypothetical protein
MHIGIRSNTEGGGRPGPSSLVSARAEATPPLRRRRARKSPLLSSTGVPPLRRLRAEASHTSPAAACAEAGSSPAAARGGRPHLSGGCMRRLATPIRRRHARRPAPQGRPPSLIPPGAGGSSAARRVVTTHPGKYRTIA